MRRRIIYVRHIMVVDMIKAVVLITLFGLWEETGYTIATGTCGADTYKSFCEASAKDGSCWLYKLTMTNCMTSCQLPPECTGGTSQDTTFACRYNAPLCDTDPSYPNVTCITTCSLRKNITCDPLEIVTGALPDINEPKYLDIVEYSCTSGYINTTQDKGRRICTKDGKWIIDPKQGKPPVCSMVHSSVNITLEKVEQFVPHIVEASNSVVFGVIAIIIFITVVGFIILLDSTTLTRHVRIFFINIGRVIMRKNPERIEDC